MAGGKRPVKNGAAGGRQKDGAKDRIRTDDRRITNAMLCQLSYFGTHVTRTMPEGRRPSQAGADSLGAGRIASKYMTPERGRAQGGKTAVASKRMTPDKEAWI